MAKKLVDFFNPEDFDHMCAFLYVVKNNEWPKAFIKEMRREGVDTKQLLRTSIQDVALKIAVAGTKEAVNEITETIGWINPYDESYDEDPAKALIT